jgi:hypothetical protein
MADAWWWDEESKAEWKAFVYKWLFFRIIPAIAICVLAVLFNN